jgi:hypothetical protein
VPVAGRDFLVGTQAGEDPSKTHEPAQLIFTLNLARVSNVELKDLVKLKTATCLVRVTEPTITETGFQTPI